MLWARLLFAEAPVEVAVFPWAGFPWAEGIFFWVDGFMRL